MANLFFFTSYYPYGFAESFIENEIKYACEAFEKVYVIPTQKSDKVRTMPSNAILIEPQIRCNHDFLKFGIKHNAVGLGKIINEFFRLKLYKRPSLIRNYIISMLSINSLVNSRQIDEVKKLYKPGDLIYSYWGYGWGQALPFIKLDGSKWVSRFHGGDLYENIPGALQPFRPDLLQRLDAAIFISKKGKKYLEELYPHLEFNPIVSYLGTLDGGIAVRNQDEKIKIVSCSYIKPVKRVDLIFEALLKMNDPKIEWTHIGAGENFEKFKKRVIETPHNFKVNLVGECSNTQVKEILKTGGVDVFINVSSSEGIPVSIMEAISFDIPVIATNVGGTSEIVNDSTGILLSANPSITEIITAIEEIKNKNIHSRKFWEENFNADTNYRNFYKLLKQL